MVARCRESGEQGDEGREERKAPGAASTEVGLGRGPWSGRRGRKETTPTGHTLCTI